MEENPENESYIETSPLLTIDKVELILGQMYKAVCNIEIGNKKGTGFFCKIYLDNCTKIGLITAFHVFRSICTNFMKIFLYNQKWYDIFLDNSRFIYKDEKNDIVFIEIKKNDNIKCSCLEIQDNINIESDFNEKYNNKLIYTLQNPYGSQSQVSFGMSKVIISGKNGYDLCHTCSTEEGSSGSPIILLENFQVIGIHLNKAKNNIKKYNKGHFLFGSIECIKKNYSKFIKNKDEDIWPYNFIEEENTKRKAINFNTAKPSEKKTKKALKIYKGQIPNFKGLNWKDYTNIQSKAFEPYENKNFKFKNRIEFNDINNDNYKFKNNITKIDDYSPTFSKEREILLIKRVKNDRYSYNNDVLQRQSTNLLNFKENEKYNVKKNLEEYYLKKKINDTNSLKELILSHCKMNLWKN